MEDYNTRTLVTSIIVAAIITLVAIVVINAGEILQVIQTDGLISR